MAEETSSSGGGCGCGCFGGAFSVGGVIAFILSFKTFHAVGWALLAAFFGWGYVVYFLVRYWDLFKQMLAGM